MPSRIRRVGFDREDEAESHRRIFVSEAQRSFERLLSSHTNALIDRLLHSQDQSPRRQLRLEPESVRVLAVQYCAAIRQVVGSLTRNLAEAAGVRQSFTEKRARWIRRTVDRFIVNKTSLQATSDFFTNEIESKFSLQNSRQARKIFRVSVAKCAKTRPPITGTSKEAKNDRRKIQRALELYSIGRARSVQRLRHLFLQAQSLRTPIEEELAYAEAKYGPKSHLPPLKIPPKKLSLRRHLANANLTARQLECLSLRFERGLRQSAIARVLGIHHSVVQEHLKQGIAKLEQARPFHPRQK